MTLQTITKQDQSTGLALALTYDDAEIKEDQIAFTASLIFDLYTAERNYWIGANSVIDEDKDDEDFGDTIDDVLEEE